MYSLMMQYDPTAWESGIAYWESGRYLEYTDDGIKSRFNPLTDDAANELKQLPTLFAFEKQQALPARVGWLRSIQRLASGIRVSFEIDPDIPPIAPDVFVGIMAKLDIDAKTEASRTHWSIKDVDLLQVLRECGALGDLQNMSPKDFQFSRQTLIRACDLLKRLGHSDFDRILLDIGIPQIDAGRNKGGLLARSTALGQYVVDHSRDPTADGEPLGYFIVKRAAESDSTYTEADEPTDPIRTKFWKSLKADRYSLQNGRLISMGSSGAPPVRPKRPYPLAAQPASVSPALATPVANMQLQTETRPSRQRVFVVHGRDANPKHDVARFLEHLGLEPVILHERPNGGRTLIAKFQEESADIVFAVVIMTPDDTGRLRGQEERPRARQNVIFELGFFIGKLGASKVCALVDGDIEKPSDFEAVVYVSYDRAGSWKNELARELQHAKVAIDKDGLLR